MMKIRLTMLLLLASSCIRSSTPDPVTTTDTTVLPSRAIDAPYRNFYVRVVPEIVGNADDKYYAEVMQTVDRLKKSVYPLMSKRELESVLGKSAHFERVLLHGMGAGVSHVIYRTGDGIQILCALNVDDRLEPGQSVLVAPKETVFLENQCPPEERTTTSPARQ